MNHSSSKPPLRVVFMGTTELSCKILETLISNYCVIGVFTKIDKKVGRDQHLVSPIVKKFAQKHDIPVLQPRKFDDETISQLKILNPDLIVVAAYGKILPKAVLDIPKYGCINVHVSLLPKYRGPSPVQNVLLSGETETGVTIMLMDEGMDTGNILTQKKIAIDPHDTTESLMDTLADHGADLLIETIDSWVDRKITPVAQDNTQATYCKMIDRDNGHIDWHDSALTIMNKFRAFSPWPGIFTFWSQQQKSVRIKLLAIHILENFEGEPGDAGTVIQLDGQIGVHTGDGIILIDELQREGKKATTASDFVRGYQNFIGSILS